VLILGGGARNAGQAALRLVERWPAAVLTTAAGRGALAEDTPYSCGLVGLYLTPPVDSLIAEADLILAVGARFEETARMRWSKPPGSLLIQVDCDANAFDVGIPADIPLLGDAALTLSALAEATYAANSASEQRSRWLGRITEAQSAARSQWRTDDFDSSPAVAALTAVTDVFGTSVTFVHENGLHDIWSYHWPVVTVPEGAPVVVPGEQTALGFGVAAAVGAALADQRRSTLVFAGDAALGMNLTALSTIAEYRLGVVFVVFDNAGFGWPRLMRRQADAPDAVTRPALELPFEPFARALGGEVMTPKTSAELWSAARRCRERAEQGQFSVLRIMVDDTVLPPAVTESSDPEPTPGHAS
jgi:acetolactate synthase I/II/III large subunit